MAGLAGRIDELRPVQVRQIVNGPQRRGMAVRIGGLIVGRVAAADIDGEGVARGWHRDLEQAFQHRHLAERPVFSARIMGSAATPAGDIGALARLAVVEGTVERPGAGSEARRGGKEGVSPCRSRGGPCHEKNKKLYRKWWNLM